MTASRTTRFAVCAVAALLVAALAAPDAEARRLGGKRSFGQQSGNVYNREAPARQQDAPPARQADSAGQKASDATPPATPAGAAARGNRWLGPVAGLAAGLGLAALFSHMGFGAGLASLLGNVLLIGLLAVGAMLLWRMIKGGGRLAYAGTGAARQPVTVQHPTSAGGAAGTWREPPVRDAASTVGAVPAQAPAPPAAPMSGPVSVTGEPLAPLPGEPSSASRATWTIPADFDVPGFVRQARVEFVRLQAAWDAGDLEDIRSFTTPQMFAEIRMDLADRGAARNVTEVVEVQAELLGIEMRARDALASVRFHGQVREGEGAPAEPFDEVWNLVKPLSGRSGWLLAGIQQAGATTTA
jgi:predicted lipid-binding transport protein (Tim44 family)